MAVATPWIMEGYINRKKIKIQWTCFCLLVAVIPIVHHQLAAHTTFLLLVDYNVWFCRCFVFRTRVRSRHYHQQPKENTRVRNLITVPFFCWLANRFDSSSSRTNPDARATQKHRLVVKGSLLLLLLSVGSSIVVVASSDPLHHTIVGGRRIHGTLLEHAATIDVFSSFHLLL